MRDFYNNTITQIARKLVLFSLFALLLSIPLFSAVTADYIPEVPVVLRQQPAPFTNPQIVAGKLGTFIVQSDINGGKIYSPTLTDLGNAGSTIKLTGLRREYNSPSAPYRLVNDNDFSIMAVVYEGGYGVNPIGVLLNMGMTTPLASPHYQPKTYNSPLYIEIFLVGTYSEGINASPRYNQLASMLKLDSPYTLPPNFKSNWSLVVAKNAGDSGWNIIDSTGSPTSDGEYVEMSHGQTGHGNTNILDPGASSDPGGGFIYTDEDPPAPVDYFFEWDESNVSFYLPNAYGSNKKEINIAKMTVASGVQGQTYTRKLTFTDLTQNSSFQLLRDGGGGNPINFKLYWGDTEISKGVSFNWANLNPGLNTKQLKIGGIDQAQASSRLSGDYYDTITLNITSP